MNWRSLLSEERERESHTHPDNIRNPFDLDYERIIGSSSVRRLQDKTQVFPLQANDFTRTRLTHSLEVSSIGRSLGRRIGIEIERSHPNDINDINDFTSKLSSLLAVTGLVHDLGNPPFGHYGETVIQKWVEKSIPLTGVCKSIREYEFFDGNAQTIRILTRLQNLSDYKGMNFTFATLATLMKYPLSYAECKEKDEHPDKKAGNENNNGSKKVKLGYFSSENKLIERILQHTGMKDRDGHTFRHPATWLLEAADDICYLFADLEDGLKKHCFSYSLIEEEIAPLADKLTPKWELKKWLEEIDAFAKHMPESERDMSKINAIRVFFQGRFIEFASQEFMNKYKEIMSGKYTGELLACESLKPVVEKVKKISQEHVFNCQEILMLELTGKTVLESLLDTFAEAILQNDGYKDAKTGSGKLYSIISDNFRDVFEHGPNENNMDDKYRKFQLIIDFISGMTDSYALNLHRSLTGMVVS